MTNIIRFIFSGFLLFTSISDAHCWGFWAHKKINYYACFLLPPQMMVLYKPNIDFLTEHAPDPDKRRYAVKEEGPRHFIDINDYGEYPYDSLPHKYADAVAKYGEETVISRGIVPWHIQIMLGRLTNAFKEKDFSRIMKNSADIGHYIADAHVPLHASNNHNGEHSNQKGIHAFWESRIPELLADKQFDFFIGKAQYLKDPGKFIWQRVIESGILADTVLMDEKILSERFAPDRKYSFEERNGITIKQYSTDYTVAYDKMMGGMVERRMRQSIEAVASFWYTAWVNAGQPDLSGLAKQTFSTQDAKEFEELNMKWNSAGKIIGREE